MAKTMSSSSPSIQACSYHNRSTHTVISDLNGTLLRSASSFPYFALAAFEAGGPLRLLFLLLLYPLSLFLHHFVSESAGIKVLIFASLAGAKLSTIESVARAVLPKFYVEVLHPETWRVLSACGLRCVVTESPAVMVGPFLKEYLGVDEVVGTELGVYRGRVTGLVRDSGVLVGERKAEALKRVFGGELLPQTIGISHRNSDGAFMNLCKESYMVLHNPELPAVSSAHLPKPIIFHDGRLVQKPTPLLSLLTILYLPFAFFLSILRIAAGSLLPVHLSLPALRSLGVRIIIQGTPPPPPSTSSTGVLFVLSHRTLLDPVFLSFSLRRPITALTYSLSRLSELISPIKTVRLTRDRATDGKQGQQDTIVESNSGVVNACLKGATATADIRLQWVRCAGIPALKSVAPPCHIRSTYVPSYRECDIPVPRSATSTPNAVSLLFQFKVEISSDECRLSSVRIFRQVSHEKKKVGDEDFKMNFSFEISRKVLD
ncbi:glycerol-3-phosphate 2-O-acyltransferase 6-like [Phalaenopsis equestris]|uniref:glycerol-3-phosphate 2-O-acyltransferase 6-like n=1 Tax=Phalaenopsis equestris TaxID=78828 RepID=UPI0009E3C98F|nr:glycerol-3-phosphate 2-O-acyltransferase 6-like [Phalaenopsis equestris]